MNDQFLSNRGVTTRKSLFYRRPPQYVVVSPVIETYLQDELVTARQIGSSFKRLLQLGALRVDSGNERGIEIKTFALKTTKEAFAQYMQGTVGTPAILPQFFDAQVGMHKFPVGNGFISVDSALSNMQVPDPAGVYTVQIHSMYWGCIGA